MRTINKLRACYYGDQIRGRSAYLVDLIFKEGHFPDDIQRCIDRDIIDEDELMKIIEIDKDEVIMAIGDLETALKELRKLIK